VPQSGALIGLEIGQQYAPLAAQQAGQAGFGGHIGWFARATQGAEAAILTYKLPHKRAIEVGVGPAYVRGLPGAP
jgi:hypothetical protein